MRSETHNRLVEVAEKVCDELAPKGSKNTTVSRGAALVCTGLFVAMLDKEMTDEGQIDFKDNQHE